MELNIQVSNEVVEGSGWYTFRTREYKVKPTRIIRYPVGRNGKARNRYYYHCEFVGFGDMLNCKKGSAVGEVLYKAIERRKNPNFNPKTLTWVDDVAVIEE